ncbi:MAG: HAD-IA family hydrolase [Pseudomonadota bacterium]
MDKIVIFDLDGTLVDSVRDLVPALNRTTALDGLPPISIEHVGSIVGKGALKMIERAFAFHDQPLTEARQKELLGHFLEFYEANIANETVYFDGCLAALDALAADGWQLAICTNKYAHLAERLMAELGGRDRFAALTGGDSFDVKKPDQFHIMETARLAGCDPARAIMVGDSINDIEAARRAPMPSIAVDFGYTDIPVADLGADTIISHFDALPDAVEALATQF